MKAEMQLYFHLCQNYIIAYCFFIARIYDNFIFLLPIRSEKSNTTIQKDCANKTNYSNVIIPNLMAPFKTRVVVLYL